MTFKLGRNAENETVTAICTHAVGNWQSPQQNRRGSEQRSPTSDWEYAHAYLNYSN